MKKYKLVFLGEQSVGKTSLITRFVSLLLLLFLGGFLSVQKEGRRGRPERDLRHGLLKISEMKRGSLGRSVVRAFISCGGLRTSSACRQKQLPAEASFQQIRRFVNDIGGAVLP